MASALGGDRMEVATLMDMDEEHTQQEPTQGQGSQARKGGGRGSGGTKRGDPDLYRILPAIAKLTLQNTQHIRALDSVMYEVHIINAKHKIVEETRQYTKDYQDEVTKVKKAKGDLAAMGPPHLAAWEGYMTGAILDLRRIATTSQPATASRMIELAVYYEQQLPKWHELGMDEAIDYIPYFRLSKTYKPETMKIVAHIRRAEDMLKLKETMLLVGAQRRPGQAPPGALERVIQKALGGAPRGDS